VHATCIAVEGRAVLLRGPSGSGKSDLALRCLALQPTPWSPARACLVADDRVLLTRDVNHVVASCPPSIAGRIEVRGLGIVPVETVPAATVVLVVDLTAREKIERFPHPLVDEALLGVRLPVLPLWPFECSAPLKVLFAIGIYGVAAAP
jgi:serine kinase of HPr protein (carbohydrate metabolism regulator)